MEFVLAKNEHIDELCVITDDAKVQLKNLGTDQWQYGYPCREVWEDDVKKGLTFVAVEEGKVCGAFAFIETEEESYKKIDGKWLTDTPYVSLHRVCVSNDVKGKGVAGKMFSFAMNKAKEMGYKSVRIDTHPGNFPMQKAIGKSNFQKCGSIYLVGGMEDGAERFAYEIIL